MIIYGETDRKNYLSVSVGVCDSESTGSGTIGIRRLCITGV